MRYEGTRGAVHRNAFELLTASNAKTTKGEYHGYLTAILYLMPHTSGGGPTLCSHSTPACREMCLAGAGMSGLPRQLAAKKARTTLYRENRPAFLDMLLRDVAKLKRLAEAEGLKPALRLNGSSDILWEREAWAWTALGLQRYDYTAIPLEHRHVDPGYHLTYSYKGPQDAARALAYLSGGHSVAVVVPEAVKCSLLHVPETFRWGIEAPLVDGDAHDLRFLDPPGSIVLLKPKGRIETGLIRPHFLRELAGEALEMA